jgi:hypothetical protein
MFRSKERSSLSKLIARLNHPSIKSSRKDSPSFKYMIDVLFSCCYFLKGLRRFLSLLYNIIDGRRVTQSNEVFRLTVQVLEHQ